MAKYTIMIRCSLLFILVAKYCSGQQATESSDDISKCASGTVCSTNRICVISGKCGGTCLNGGTCCISSCHCLEGYSGTHCEYKYFGNEPFRKIQFITAYKISDNNIPYLNTIVNKDSLYFKVVEGCKSKITLLQDEIKAVAEIIINDTNSDEPNIQNDPSLFTINLSCRRFSQVDVFISWTSNHLTFGTVRWSDDELWRTTIKHYQLDGHMYKAIFSSGENISWILYEPVVDDKRAIRVQSFGEFSKLCPLIPQRKEGQLHVNFLSRSSRCSAHLEVEATYEPKNIIIKFRCNITTEKCSALQQILWISACQASATGCNNCTIVSHRINITRTCQNSASLRIKTDNQLNTTNDVSQYLIIWHEIKDVFYQDQSSSQKPLPTAEVFPTTFSYSASYTTEEEQWSPISSFQTTSSLTTTYNEEVSLTSTAGNMLIDDNKPHPISDNQKVIGLTVGASVSAAIIVILLICLLVVLRRRSIERNSAKKNQTVQNSGDANDYTGRQNIALPMQDLTEYNELAMRRDSHQYGDLTSVGTKLNETTYDYIDHHKHKQETDICKIDKINSIQDPGDESSHDYSVLDPNEKITNTVKVMLNTERDGDTYAVLDPDEFTTLCSGTDNSDRLDKPCFESDNKHTKELTCSQTKDEAYAVLDPNITGFDRTENVAKTESAENYTVLDPSITGFNRSDLTHGPGDMTTDHVNKKSLIQPKNEDGTDYEFAKPIDDDMLSRSCLPSYRDRANSGESYGTYQTGNTRPIQDINQQNSEENVYNRTVDDVYDSAAHTKMPTSRDDTYDHFSGEKM